ncbi:MAG: TolC family outer membrane protein [Betaproteobacteria bacterium]|nr:TolC family outer membrane protein [Betaproteobacteria bacterium]
MNLKRLVVLLAASGFALSAQGADLIGVYRDALSSDPVYQAARAQYQASIERLPQARAGYLPFLTGSAGAYRNYNQRDGVEDLDYSTRGFNLTLSQPVFRMQSWIAISQAEKQVIQAEATLTTASQDLIVRVAQAYFDVLLAQDNVALSDAQKRAISEQLAQAKRNFEVGTATIVDTLEAQARYDQAVAKEVLDANDLEVKKRALQQLIGKFPEALKPLGNKLELQRPKPDNIDEWVKAASESSLAVLVAKASYEIAAKEVDRAQAGHYPTVDLNATYNYNRNPASSLGELVTGASITSKNAQVGLVLSVPIFAGGGTQSRVREALALRDRSQQDLENTQRTVAQSVRQNFLAVTNGIALVRALEQALASTQSQLESSILGRDVGVRTSVDVLNAQQQVFQTRRDLQQARYAFILNSFRLRAAAGTLTEADLEQASRALALG